MRNGLRAVVLSAFAARLVAASSTTPSASVDAGVVDGSVVDGWLGRKRQDAAAHDQAEVKKRTEADLATSASLKSAKTMAALTSAAIGVFFGQP